MKNIPLKDIFERDEQFIERSELLQDINFRLYNYLVLNGSFSDHVGLVDGKGACSLYFYCMSKYVKNSQSENIAFTFLDELISSLNSNIPIHFENGFAGIGVLVEYLSKNNFIEEDTNELLKEPESFILSSIYFANQNEVNISIGVSGLGLYCMHRLTSLSTLDTFQQLRLKEAVIACVDQIDQILTRKNTLGKKNDWTILDGHSGVLLFLNWVSKLKWYEPVISDLIEKLFVVLEQEILDTVFDWKHLEIYFALFYCNTPQIFPHEKLLGLFSNYINKAIDKKLTPADFFDSAFSALWCELLYKNYPSESLLLVRDKLKKFHLDFISNKYLGDLFPFSSERKTLALSLRNELCATALCILSLSSQDYSWLAIYGINIQQND